MRFWCERTVSLEEKLEVKRLGPHHPRDIGINRCIFETMYEGDARLAAL